MEEQPTAAVGEDVTNRVGCLEENLIIGPKIKMNENERIQKGGNDKKRYRREETTETIAKVKSCDALRAHSRFHTNKGRGAAKCGLKERKGPRNEKITGNFRILERGRGCVERETTGGERGRHGRIGKKGGTKAKGRRAVRGKSRKGHLLE